MATTKRPRPEVEHSGCATAEDDDDDEWYIDGDIGPRVKGDDDDEADHPLTHGRQRECKWLWRQESCAFGASLRSYGAAL